MNPPNAVRGRRLGVPLLVLAAVVAVIGLAAAELRSRGVTGVGGFTVANYQAAAEPQHLPAPCSASRRSKVTERSTSPNTGAT